MTTRGYRGRFIFRSMVYGLWSNVFLLLLNAQEKAEPADARYLWAVDDAAKWKEAPVAGGAEVAPGQAVQSKNGISAEAYDRVIRDNIKLRQDNAEVRKSFEDAGKINSDLMAKVKALDAAQREAAATRAVKVEGSGGAGSDLATTLDENLTLREQKRTLDSEVVKLKAEVVRLQARSASVSTGTAVPEQSDLFKRLQQENALLKQELQKQQQAGKLASEEGKTAAGANADARKTVQKLAEDNAVLKKAVIALDAQSREAVSANQKLAVARKDLEQKDKLLAEAARAIEKQAGERERFAGVAMEIEEFRKERSNLLFNLGALYTRVGMYSEAVDALNKVLEAQPRAPDVHYNLGILYDKYLKDMRKAEYHYKKFLELDPSGQDAEKVKLWLLGLEI
ncbi:MAG: hypothetical protein WCN95_06335 [bacterium]